VLLQSVTHPYVGIPVDKTLLLFLFGVLLFASPLVDWWTTPSTSWLTSYILWAVLIGLIALVVHRDER
jgi:hypothetical protein